VDEKKICARSVRIARPGMPTATELIKELQTGRGLFRQVFERGTGEGMANNCRDSGR